MSLFKVEFLIQLLVDTIDESKCIDFYNERSRKIPTHNINLTLSFIPKECFEKYGIVSNDSSYEDKVEYMLNIVHEELIDRFVTKLVTIVDSNKDFLETLNKELCDLEIFKDDFESGTIVKETLLDILSVSTIFGVNIAEDLTSATVQYFY